VAHTDGDGWMQCSCGHKHWGLHGAAGLLLVRDGTILLQHRAPWVHNGVDLIAHEMNDESQEIRWVLFDDVTKMNLHPSFARNWPDLQALLGELLI